MTINPGKAAIFGILILIGGYGAGYYASHPVVAPVIEQEPVVPVPPVEEEHSAPATTPTVTATEVVEDSRCPINARCIWAGTVKVKATVTLGPQSQPILFTLGEPQSALGHTITLASVTPERMAGTGKDLTFNDYTFSFEVK